MTTVVSQSRPIPIRNAWLAREAIRVYDPVTNAYKSAEGLAFTVRFSLVPTGYVGASKSTIASLGPFNMTESTVKGTYYYEVLPTLLVAALGSIVGTTIYQIVEGGPSSELCVVQPLVVTDPRYTTP